MYQTAAAAVSRAFGVSIKDLMGPHRGSFAVSDARLALYVLLDDAGATREQTGRWLGRNHTTVTHGIKAAKELMQTNPSFRKAFLKAANTWRKLI